MRIKLLLMILINLDHLLMVVIRLRKHWNCEHRTSMFNRETSTLYYECASHKIYYKFKLRP